MAESNTTWPRPRKPTLSEPEVLIPRLYPFCSSRVTAMERIDGHKVTEPGEHDLRDRRRLAELIVEALIAGPIWSADGPGDLSCRSPRRQPVRHPRSPPRRSRLEPDRNPGRMRSRRDDPTGARRPLSERRRRFARVFSTWPRTAALTRRHSTSVIHDWLRRIRQGMFPGFSWLMGMLDDAVLRAKLRAATDLIMFRKALLTLDGVLADVSPEVRVDKILPALFLRRLVEEWPRRFWTSPLSRSLRDPPVERGHCPAALALPSTPARAVLENTLELISRIHIQ